MEEVLLLKLLPSLSSLQPSYFRNCFENSKKLKLNTQDSVCNLTVRVIDFLSLLQMFCNTHLDSISLKSIQTNHTELLL